ncbi:MAG: OmpA family protein [Cyclobacteriaceae bacterium]|nr:OmpA family protein [Cyclobacteriaceae bacterium]
MKQILLLLLLTAAYTPLLAQDWMGLHSSNYAGVQGISLQPASIADSRYKFQMNLFSFNTTVSNNYYAIENADFRNLKFDFDFDELITLSKNKDRGAFLSSDVYAPLSFMLTTTPKSAIGITVRSRSMVNIDGVSPEMADFIDEQIDSDDFVIDPGQTFDVSNMYGEVHSWGELGFTYARIFMDQGTHFLKAGTTVKLMSGIGSGYVYVNNLNYSGLTDDRVDVANLDVRSGYSDNISPDDDNDFEYKLFQNFSVGLDLGVVYEFRPNIESYKYSMDGADGLIRRDKNKYKYKVGFSLLDLGGIKYNKSNDSGNVSGSADDLDINDLEGDLDEILEDYFNFERGGSYRMGLPTRMVGEFDYRVSNVFYLNFTTQLGLKGGSSDVEKTRYISTLALTPRLEGRSFGVALPLSYDKFSSFNSGVSFRAGPLIVGSRDVVSAFVFGKDPRSVDLHFGLRFGIPFRKKKDKDMDGVSNKLDACPQIAGVWEFKGCPDRDSDGTQDSEDICPDLAGPQALKGCPDMDADGVADKDDSCPEVAGLPEFSGCPDQDGDGLPDKEDDCPEVAGLKMYNGCPDQDGDGIIDRDDLCPELPGDKAKFGCPDSDGDGMFDNEDQCPKAAGPAENNGCPYADSDGDGVIDAEDECVIVPGVPENNGCPVLEEEEQEILNTAFSNLEFESGKAKIATSSYSSLVELANLLKQKPDWKLQISGHTDAVGNAQSNLKLSKARAQAVADFLTEQGIDRERFSVLGFGQDSPIATNATAAGRKMNRRVELEVIFK